MVGAVIPTSLFFCLFVWFISIYKILNIEPQPSLLSIISIFTRGFYTFFYKSFCKKLNSSPPLHLPCTNLYIYIYIYICNKSPTQITKLSAIMIKNYYINYNQTFNRAILSHYWDNKNTKRNIIISLTMIRKTIIGMYIKGILWIK